MVAAHITGMPAALTVDSAAELAATLAHTSALLREDDSGYPAFRTVTPHLADTERAAAIGTPCSTPPAGNSRTTTRRLAATRPSTRSTTPPPRIPRPHS